MSRGLEKTCKNEQQENQGERLRKIGKFFFSTELNWTEALSVNIW